MYSTHRTDTTDFPDRTQKVKDARSEAAKEVEAYKTQKDKDFKQFELEVLSSFLLNLQAYGLAYWVKYTSRTSCQERRGCKTQRNRSPGKEITGTGGG